MLVAHQSEDENFLMTKVLPRTGIGVAFQFATRPSHVTLPVTNFLRFSNSTFQYHLPRRIPHPPPSLRQYASNRLAPISPRHVLGLRSRPLTRPTYAFSATSKSFHHLSRLRDQLPKQEQDQRQLKSDSSTDKAEQAAGKTQQNGGEYFYERIPRPNFHRPTKEELLAACTGFWSRLRVRFKWATIKSVRPFNMDEIFGFFSWIAIGHVLWLIIGTTTFVSLAILAINTVFAQETLAGWVGEYLTKSSGLKVVFESAIVPRWGNGVITFKNVFVSRRPGHDDRSTVRKGSPQEAAIAAATEEIPAEDQNYTQFDITLGEVNVTLSFSKWWNSKGLLQNVEIKHVRGVVDRTHVFWSGEPVDPKTFRHEHVPGDFEIESFKVEDMLLTLHQPNGFRPFTVSIFNADLPRFRKQWIMYDLLCANSITGEYDGSLFTIHPRQTHSYTGALLNEVDASEPWRKQNRIRIDSLNIDHLNRGVEGPFGWINEGNVDIVADLMIPSDNDESVIKVMSDVYDQIEAQFFIKKKHLQDLLEQNSNFGQDEIGPDASPRLPLRSFHTVSSEQDRRYLVMDLRIHLNDVRASVPLFTKDLSYVNNALIRPIVAYINSRRTFIPINCRLVKRVNDFDGSWTIFDSGLMDELSEESYEAFSRDVTDEQARMRRFKKVGLWSLQLAVQAIFLGMAGNIA